MFALTNSTLTAAGQIQLVTPTNGMSGNISPPTDELGDSEGQLSIVLVVVFVTVIVVCVW